MLSMNTLRSAAINLKCRLDEERSHRQPDGTYDPEWLGDIVAQVQSFARLAKNFESHNIAAGAERNNAAPR